MNLIIILQVGQVVRVVSSFVVKKKKKNGTEISKTGQKKVKHDKESYVYLLH